MNTLKFVNRIQSVLIAVLLLGISWLLISHNQEQSETVPASLNADIAEPETVIVESEICYETTGQKILLKDATFGEIWIPVLADVPACTYEAEQFVTRNNLTFYLEDDKIISQFGIDVSAHQGEIDWQAVKDAGVDFAIIRAGYRGYSGGILVEDEYFQQNLQGAKAAGLEVGVYFYSQAISVEEAVEEAEMTISLLNGEELTYPVVYDWEIVSTDSARTDNVSVKTLTDCSIAFCETVKAAGYTPMIYQNKRTSLLKLDLPELVDYDFWLAEYNDEATYYYQYQIWQYASDGTVAGISGNVDMNICFKNYASSEPDEADTE